MLIDQSTEKEKVKVSFFCKKENIQTKISINEKTRQQIPIRGKKSKTIVAQPIAADNNILKYVNNQRQQIKNIQNLSSHLIPYTTNSNHDL